MSEYVAKLPSSEDPEWVGLVLDVENRIEALNDSLADLRSAVIRLSSYRPQPLIVELPVEASPEDEAAEAPNAVGEGLSVLEAEILEPEAAEEPEFEVFALETDEEPEAEALTVESVDEPEFEAFAVEAVEGSEFEQFAVETVEEPELEMEPAEEPEPVELALQAVLETEAIATPLDDEEAARREEVRRMVAEARQEVPGGVSSTPVSWTEPHRGGDVDSTSEGSWPIARRPGLPIIPPGARMTFDESIESSVSHEGTGPEPNPEYDARREEVARMVAAMRSGLDPVQDTEAQAPVDAAGEAQDDWPREDVAKVVAELRAEIGAEPEETGDGPVLEDEATRREDVADMVARMRAEMGESGDEGESASNDADSPAGDKDVRNEVRRAVEAARAEMASGWVRDEAETASSEVKEKPKFSFPDWQTTHMEPMGPPVIVIKDPEGRVELARVYETLAQVHCDENAALLNYTPHSVTVGLNLRASVPTKDAMEKAIETVFGRKCRVESDGVRVSVDIGMGENAA